MKFKFIIQQNLPYKNDKFKRDILEKKKTEYIRSLIKSWSLGLFFTGVNFGFMLLITKLQIVVVKILIYIIMIFMDSYAYFVINETIVLPSFNAYGQYDTHISSSYTMKPSDLTKNKWYNIAKNDPKKVFVDPLYVGRLNPMGTTLLSYENIELNWIPYKERTIICPGMFFAVIPLTLVATNKSGLVIRVFLANLTDSSETFILHYVPSIRKFKVKSGILVSAMVSPKSIYYQDVVVPSKNIPKREGKNRLFRIVDTWSTLETKFGIFSNKYKITTYDESLAMFPFIYTRFKSKIMGRSNILTTMIKQTEYFGLAINKFVAPTAIKEIVIFSLSNGTILFKEEYLLRRSVIYILLVNILILPLMGLNAYLTYFSIIRYHNLFFMITFFIYTIVCFLFLRKITKIKGKKEARKLYKMGLTENKRYITEEDIFDIYNKHKELTWLSRAIKTINM